jgi:hypothetical protein
MGIKTKIFFQKDFSTNRCCHKRKMFIDICNIAYELYSKTFFKSWFYQHLIELASDGVVNVRIAFVKIIPKLKLLWNAIVDKAKLNALENTVGFLLSDKDRDVRECTENVCLHSCWPEIELSFIRSFIIY